MKLHLGCGQKYLKGYVNVDFPLSKHTVQNNKVADIETDISKLRYKKGTIEEIKLHHLLEHFPRANACALIGSWNSWLKEDGKLIIEVPDFQGMLKVFLNPLSSKVNKRIALRHVFGSQEADWGVHYNGWTGDQFGELYNISGFKICDTIKSQYKNTKNILVRAIKICEIDKNIHAKKIEDYLSSFLVDNSSSEREMLNIWMKEYKKQIELTWAKQ